LSRKKRSETINDWLTRRHQLILRNEENFEEKTTLVYTNAKALVLAFTIFVSVSILAIVLDRYLFSLLGNSRIDSNSYNRQLIILSTKVDSLDRAMELGKQYRERVQAVLAGKDPDELFKKDSNDAVVASVMTDTVSGKQIDAKIRAEFEGDDGANIDLITDSRLTDVLLFSPVNAYAISQKFNTKSKHYGIDVLTEENEVIKAAADGMVIFSDWSIEGGHTLVIQHNNELVSVYKQAAVLLKKTGDFVNSGDPVGIVGNSGKETSGHHLHFELWFEKEPFNPENVIRF